MSGGSISKQKSTKTHNKKVTRKGSKKVAHIK